MSRNVVTLGPCYMRKDFSSRIAFDKEVTLYQLLGDTRKVPQLIAVQPLSISLEHLPGPTLRTLPPTADLLHQYAAWHVTIQRHCLSETGQAVCLEDCNLGNFILSQGYVFGFDFESWHFGSLAEAFALPLAHLYAMGWEDLRHRDKMLSIVTHLFCQAGVDSDHLASALQTALDELTARRRIQPLLRRTTAGILLGGQGRRMGGVDKSQLVLGNYTFLEHLEYQLGAFDHLLYSARQPMDPPPVRGRVVLDHPAGIGPAGGVNALLQACTSDYLLVWSCDMPYLNTDFLVRFLTDLPANSKGRIPMVAHRPYPLSGLYATSVQADFAQSIADGNRKLTQLIAPLGLEYTPFSPAEPALRNINTPQEFFTF